MKKLLTGLLVSMLASVSIAYAAVDANGPPDQLVKSVVNDVIQIISTDPGIQKGDTSHAIAVAEPKVLPYFNFSRMTALAVGKDWRSATPQQKETLTKEFRALLMRSYANAFAQNVERIKNQTVDVKPVQVKPEDTDVLVRTEIKQPGGRAIAINYSLQKKTDGWKVYDVIVEGASLVANYRDTFAQEIRTGGVDGLIKTLQAKNQSGQVSSTNLN